MMKKYILVFIANFLTIPLFSASFAESSYAHKRHEVSISYGILPITGWMDTFTDLFSDAITGAIEGAQTRSRNSTSWGALNLMYNYRINSRVAFGAIYSYSGMKEDIYSDNLQIGKSRTSFHTIMPMFKFNWFNKPLVTMYTRIGIGLVLSFDKEEYFTGVGDYHSKNAYLAWQVSPVGIEIGKSLAGFLELGFGTTGLFSAGLRYRF
ncbi:MULTISPECIES: hypothetical protein [Bacteroidales]|mgnify:CR=1 FL=1|uniref:hypothetical protein n=1 Tax=Bacteroidales TaxID=171549 RepID=UPI0012B663BA|nr:MULTISPECIES: hypothetical protein [Bacteroidales]